MNNKALLFDLGGVVIDIDFQRVAASWASSAKVADWCNNPQWQKLGPQLAKHPAFHQFERGESSSDQFFYAIAQELNIAMTRDQWIEGWNHLFVGEFAGTQALLRSIRREYPAVKIFALSNINTLHHQVTTTRFADLLTQFDRVFYSHLIGLRKPEPACFQFIETSTNTKSANILFFDDFQPNVDGAIAAGLQAEVFTSPTLTLPRIKAFLKT